MATLGYYTYRLHSYAVKTSKAFEYVYAAIDCLIQENGQVETDVNVLFQGYKTREAYFEAVNKESPGLIEKDRYLKRQLYDEQIPECKKFYSQYRCWELDPRDPASLDGCGRSFGLTQSEIDTMKKDPNTIKAIMDASFKRHN